MGLKLWTFGDTPRHLNTIFGIVVFILISLTINGTILKILPMINPMTLQKSGLCYPNKIALIYVTAIEETIGSEAMKIVFKVADIPENLYPPPNNLAKEFDFVYYGALGAALEKMYGSHGERGLTLHAGRACFTSGLTEFGSLIGAGDLAFKAIPLKAKLKIGLRGMAETFSKFSDQKTGVSETDEHLIYTIYTCPICWGRKSNKVICYGAVGVIEAGLHWVSGGKNIAVEQIACHAAGDEHCVFHIAKEPLD